MNECLLNYIVISMDVPILLLIPLILIIVFVAGKEEHIPHLSVD